MRFLRVVTACVFDPLLPGVCLHASCHTRFLGPLVIFFSLIHLFLELFYYFYYYLLLRVFCRLKFLPITLKLWLHHIYIFRI